MRKIKFFKSITALTLVLLLALPFTAISEEIGESVAGEGPQEIFKPEELDQLLAPIALYPDALLAQVLTASTYPLEVVAASRFVKENPGLKGQTLLEAAKDKDWEPSVKVMLEFPDVLAMMDEQLEWTEKLGQAFLAQQGDCMDTVQRLRQKAHEQGNLVTSQEQVIRVQPQTKIIIIEPASPTIVYVPAYDPWIIYGHWWHPAYPPYHFHRRRHSVIWFYPRIFVGLFWGTWGCNWYSRDVHISINHYRTFTRTYYHRSDYDRFYRDGQVSQPWRYDSRHRSISGYRGTVTRTVSTAPAVRVNKQVITKQPVITTKETARPLVKNSTKKIQVLTNVQKMPAGTLKEVLTQQIKTKPAAKVDVRTKIEKQISVETVTRNFVPKKVFKPSASPAKVEVKSKVETTNLKNNVEGWIRNQGVARQPEKAEIERSSRKEIRANPRSFGSFRGFAVGKTPDYPVRPSASFK